MSNPYFRFKQFTVYQDKAAMKVCTDSCLFGAWAADYLLHQTNTKNILDIGAGTGLLSLQLAQKNSKAEIDAVESEPSSFQQAEDNCRQSPWAENISVHQSRIQDFFPGKQYDAIISNPPFYEDDVLSVSETKNMAHHNAGLTLKELITASERLLSSKGRFAVLLPYHRTNEFEAHAHEAGIFLNNKIPVKQTPKHSYFRSICVFSFEKTDVVQNDMMIKDEQDNYAPAFVHLLKDYYLYL